LGGDIIMDYPLVNASQLEPIVREAVVSLYGNTANNIKVQEVQKIPLFRTPKHSWQVNVLFNNEEHKYNVQFEIKIIDGLVTKVQLLHRELITTDKK
jgi:hypothetical protein